MNNTQFVQKHKIKNYLGLHDPRNLKFDKNSNICEIRKEIGRQIKKIRGISLEINVTLIKNITTVKPITELILINMNILSKLFYVNSKDRSIKNVFYINYHNRSRKYIYEFHPLMEKNLLKAIKKSDTIIYDGYYCHDDINETNRVEKIYTNKNTPYIVELIEIPGHNYLLLIYYLDEIPEHRYYFYIYPLTLNVKKIQDFCKNENIEFKLSVMSEELLKICKIKNCNPLGSDESKRRNS